MVQSLNPASPIVLPSRYYLDHFLEMLAFVASKYDHALSPEHRMLVEDFRALSDDARCLFVRIANRKGRIFRREHLCYSEIEDLEAATAELVDRGFVRRPTPKDFEDLLALEARTNLLTRIRGHLEELHPSPPRLSSLKKDELIRLALTSIYFETAFPTDELDSYLVQLRCEEVSFLLFLYFGSLHRDLTTFALRDLGRVRTASFRADFEPRFASGEAARASFHYAGLLQQLEKCSPEQILKLTAGVEAWPLCADPEVEGLRHHALHRLGRLLERDHHLDKALEVYTRSDQYPSTERAVRLLYAAGRREEAERLLHKLIDDPSCDGELLFAEDFLERKYHRKKTGRLTELLRSAPILPLDESGRDQPEAAAVARFRREGADAGHVENRLWLQLFGLLFWDLLFGPELAALHDPFDFTPQDLSSGTFLDRHGPTVLQRLAGLDDATATLAALDAIWAANHSVPNSLVLWDEELYSFTRRLVAAAPKNGLAPLLLEMARDYRNNRSGFPDLLVFEDGRPRFLEIKTEGDQIRRQQFVQFERMRKGGFEVGIANVIWVVDPEQDYVVVDLETTGGDAGSNRITEIGAVRVRDGQILDEWSTLVNPERRIPSFIAKLTGISDTMVASAPRFAEVAERFRDFVGSAVFVAHRVKFDHGFLKAEYARLGQRFVCPTLCTVVEMRRHFPGLPSYGLGPLSAHFGISLESHHRALCDARATAELLIRINAKRTGETVHKNEMAQKRD